MVVFKILKIFTALRCNYSLCTNIYSSLIQTDRVQLFVLRE